MKRIKTGEIDKRYLKRLEVIVLCPYEDSDLLFSPILWGKGWKKEEN